ncbi:unnamed protein product, partial [Ixodes pacificus]
MCLAFVRFHTRGPRIVATSPTPPKPEAATPITSDAETNPPLTPEPKPGSTSEPRPGSPLTQYTRRAPPGASSAPAAPETPPNTSSSAPPAPGETPGTAFSAPSASRTTPGISSPAPPAPGETLGTSSSAPPGPGTTPGTSSRSHAPAASSSTTLNPFPSAASSSSPLNRFATRTPQPPGAVAQMMALPGGETQLGPPEQVPTVYDLVVVIDANEKTKKHSGNGPCSIAACDDNSRAITMSETQRVSCALPTPARGYDQHWRHIIGSRSRGRLFWLRVEGVNAARFSLIFFWDFYCVDHLMFTTSCLLRSRRRSEKLKLADVACLVGWQRCGQWVVDQLHIEMSDI